MTDKWTHDKRHWDANPPELPEGWTRYPIPLERTSYWDALPEGVEEGRILFVELRPSSIMGHGEAAVWVGPEDTR